MTEIQTQMSVGELVDTIVHASECMRCEIHLDIIVYYYPHEILQVIEKNTEDGHRALTLLLSRGSPEWL